MLKAIVHALGRRYIREVCRREFLGQSGRRVNERAVEYGFVFRQLAALCPANVLDVGTGGSALPSLVRTCGFPVSAVDNVVDYWPKGMVNRHYHVLNDDIRKPSLGQRFEAVTCVSVLEHIEDHLAAIEGIRRVLKPGGFLIATFPYAEDSYVRNVYDLPDSSYGKGAPYICQSFSRKEVAEWTAAGGWLVKEQEYWRLWSGTHWTCGRSLLPPQRVAADEPHQLTCLLLQSPK